MIVALPRSGSNMLASLLDSHPDVLCHHELFNPKGVRLALGLRGADVGFGGVAARDRDPLAFLERVWRFPGNPAAVGFKMTGRQNERVLAAVLADRAVGKVVLSRRNRVRAYVSHQISERLGEWEVYSPRDLAAPRPRVRVDVGALRARLAADRAFMAEVRGRLRATGQPAHEVAYEEVVSGPGAYDQGRLARVVAFLGVPPCEGGLRTPSVRQNPGPLRELVENYDELAAALAGTDLAPDLTRA